MTRFRNATFAQRLYYRYFLGPPHPAKLRICRLIRFVLRDARVSIPFHEGFLWVDEQDFVERHVLVHGDYEPEVRSALMQFAEKDEVVWDIGAHIGSFSLPLLKNPAVASIVAFEPHPDAIARIRANIALWDAPRYRLLAQGLSDSAGEQAITDGTAGNSGTATMGTGSGNRHTVLCGTIDEAVAETGRAPSLIKMDVEGFEEKVLRGGLQTLSRTPPKALVIEAVSHPNGDIAEDGIVGLLADYRCQRVIRPLGTIEPRENYLFARK